MYYIIKFTNGGDMMKINKTYRFRLYPNDSQIIMINKTIGCTRLVYNHYLSKKQEMYKNEHKSMSAYECIKDLKNLYVEYPFLKEADSMSLRCSIFDLENSFEKMFKEHTGYPKYKSKYDKNTYRTNFVTSSYKGKVYENIKVDLINKTITLPKLKDIKISGYRNLDNIDGRIINATVIKEKTGKYYVSVLYEQEIEEKEFIPNNIVGIDVGVKDLVITSDGKKYLNNKAIIKYEKRIKRKQKELARRIKGSNNYNKTKKQIAILYSKLTNARIYAIHEITKEITDNNDIIVTETLKVSNMLKNRKLAKRIQDASLSLIIRQLTYKAKWKFKKLYQISTFYPSSQICSHCGYKNEITKNLGVREYVCPNCHIKLDRDINSSENIMFEGLKLYMKELIA